MTVRRHKVSSWRAWVVVAAVAAVSLALPAWGAIFTDIQGLGAQRAIERLAAKGVFGRTGDRFNPSGTVTRVDLAVFLFKALAFSSEGLGVPELKDAAEIPKDALPAVTVMTRMGTVSGNTAPQKTELKKGALVYRLTSDKAVYGPTEQVMLRFSVENSGKEDIKFDYTSDLHFDFIIRDSEGNEVARRSLGLPVRQVDMSVALVAGRSIEFGAVWWFQRDQNDAPVPPGRYEITALHLTKSNPTTVSLIFNKGLMQVFPDNTFRSKAEVSRADLAATMVRALGLGDGAPSVLQGVIDAGEIPEALRGVVAAAIDKRIVVPGPDRAFRPTRPATRADAAGALDVLMETLKRYDFSKGTLKDIRVGTPTLMTIEEENKAQRTFRVARAYAVYRNNAAADLKDLKAGDTLLFLKAGDVGDVTYIEATGR